MISNRLTIELAIDRARKSLKKLKRDRQKNGRRWPEAEVVRQGLTDKEHPMVAGGTSDDACGSADERAFLAGRRVSLPGTSLADSEERLLKAEEERRRKFLAQFSDRRDIVDGLEITAARRTKGDDLYDPSDSNDDGDIDGSDGDTDDT